jgi:hypothetical protein
MPIPITCNCGRMMRVTNEAAGRKIRCPGCSVVLTVPNSDAPKDVDEEALKVLLEDSPDESVAIRQRSWNEPSPLSNAPPPVSRPSPAHFSKTDAGKKPPLVKPARKLKKDTGGGLFNNMEVKPHIAIPGLITMLIAVVWFFGALMVGIIFVYPIILFFIGGGMFFRGITRGGEY